MLKPKTTLQKLFETHNALDLVMSHVQNLSEHDVFNSKKEISLKCLK